MMLLARELGEPVSDYWIRGSRTQDEILSVISQMTNVPPDSIHIGVDGCGVPVYAVPFRAIASSYLRLQQPELIRDERLAEAVARNVSMQPFLIYGIISAVYFALAYPFTKLAKSLEKRISINL